MSMRDGPTSADGGHVHLIFAGCSDRGHRQARQTAALAIEGGAHAIVFDSWDGGKENLALVEPMELVDYSDRDRARWSVRLEHSVSNGRLRTLARKWNTVTQGYLNWRLIRLDVKALARETQPVIITYCDEFAQTAAWHAARIWPTATIRNGQRQ